MRFSITRIKSSALLTWLIPRQTRYVARHIQCHNTINHDSSTRRNLSISSASLQQAKDKKHITPDQGPSATSSTTTTPLSQVDSEKTPIGKVKGKLLFGYTCKVCDTRQYRTMSKDAYEKGVVIVKCGGCKSLHLIADHLGWFDSTRKIGTIEDILREKGRENEVKTLTLASGNEWEWLPDAIQEAESGTHSTVKDDLSGAKTHE